MIIIYWIIAIGLCLLLLGLLAVFALTLLYLFPMVKGAVYVPSKLPAIESMLQLAQLRPGMKTVDLGSGDGRVVIAFAQAGAEAHGYEINPLLVWRARRAVRRAKLQQRAFIHLGSYWDVDLSQFQVITVYGITYIMKDLEEKLRLELKRGSKVLSNFFTFPGWKPKKSLQGIHLYIR